MGEQIEPYVWSVYKVWLQPIDIKKREKRQDKVAKRRLKCQNSADITLPQIK